MRIKHVHHTDYIFISTVVWCSIRGKPDEWEQNKRLEQLLQARQREFATKWGRAALPHERLTYFPLEDLIKNNGKKIRSDKKHFLECNEDK